VRILPARVRLTVTAGILVAGAAVAGCAGTPAAVFATGSRTGRPLATQNDVWLAASGRSDATLAVVSGAATLTISAAPLPGQLLRVRTPANSGVRPQLVQADGRVQLFLASTGQSGPSAVWIELSSSIRWQLQFSGGDSRRGQA
jgi:hypothetical protein